MRNTEQVREEQGNTLPSGGVSHRIPFSGLVRTRYTSNVSRAIAMIVITIRSILFNRKTMVVAVILLLLSALPVIWIMYPPSEEEDQAVEITTDHYSGIAPFTASFTGVPFGLQSPFHYQWDFGDGTRSTEEQPRHTYHQEGMYDVRLEVRDDENSIVSSEPLTILVLNEKSEEGLFVAISVNRSWGREPHGVQFGAAFIGGEAPYTFMWNFGEGNTSGEQYPAFMYTDIGRFNVTLTVQDSVGNTSDSNVLYIQVEEENELDSEMDFFMGLVVILYLQLVVLYVCFLYASALITSEVDDRTITYLISRPIRKVEIVVYKYIGYVISLFLLFSISVVINYGILASHQGGSGITDNLDFLAFSLGGILIGIILWGAFFIFLASVIRNPLMPGFLICIFWESLIANIGTNVSKLTGTYIIRTFIINGLKELRDSIAQDGDLPVHGDMSAPETFLLAVVISIVFLILASIKLKERDFY